MSIKTWIDGMRRKMEIKRRNKIVKEYKTGYEDFKGVKSLSISLIGGDLYTPYNAGAQDVVNGIPFEKGVRKCLNKYGIILHHAENFPDYKALADFLKEESISSGDHFAIAAQAIYTLNAYQQTEVKTIYAVVRSDNDEFISFIDDQGNFYPINRIDEAQTMNGASVDLIGPIVILSGEQDS